MLAVGPFGLGAPELIIILVILVLLFGATRLVDIGGSLGRGIREFRKNIREPAEPEEARPTDQPTSASPPPPRDLGVSARTCSNCNAQLASDAKFCAECGAPTQATVQ